MSETIENLAKAFIGESQARNRYNMYANVAKKEGYPPIAKIFNETAEHEQEHAQWHFRLINQLKDDDEIYDELEVVAGAPTACGDTIENLKAAIGGENYESNTMYPEFAAIAEKEGHAEIAERLKAIAVSEEHHKERYAKLLKQLEDGTLYKKKEKVWWYCLECGYKHYGKEPPKECPSCDHPRGYYMVMNEKY